MISNIYDSAQLLSINLRTSPKVDSKTNVESYTGLANEEADYSARMVFLKSALELAKKQASADSKVLKILVTPEFFFRPKSGVYSAESTKVVHELLKQIVADEMWKDWLFFFGSIVGDAKHLGYPEQLKTFTAKTIAHNIVPILGGNGGRSLITIKQYTALKDFVGKATAGLQTDIVLLEDIKQEPVNAIATDITFQTCGFTFGVEVCVDHSQARLRNHLKLTKEGRPQFHIVTGCGILMHTYKMSALPGGHVFYVDGGPSQTASFLYNLRGRYRITDAPTADEIDPVSKFPLTGEWKTLWNDEVDPELYVYQPVNAPKPEDSWA